MSDHSWYQRKFGRQQQPAPQQRPAPQGYPPAQDHRQVSPQYGTPPPQQPPPRVTIENLWPAMHHWKGGKAHQVDREPCPACGGNHFFSRSSGVRRGPPPAPLCYDCGFNGMFEQGLESSWSG